MARSIQELAAAIAFVRAKHRLDDPDRESTLVSRFFDHDTAPPKGRPFDWWRAFEVIAVLIGLVATLLAWQANELARQALRDQQVSSAWQILANRQPGSSGKQYALGVLLGADDSVLSNVDLECLRARQPMSDGIDFDHPAKTKCVDGVDLSRMSVVAAIRTHPWTLEESDLSGVNLRHATLRGGRVRSVNLSEANLTMARIVDANLSFVSFADANLSGAKFEGTTLTIVNFSHANLTGADFSKAVFRTPSNISGAVLCPAFPELDCASPHVEMSVALDMAPEQKLASQRALLSNGWFWDDDPPTGIRAEMLALATSCPAADRYSRDFRKRLQAVCRSEPGLAESFSIELQ